MQKLWVILCAAAFFFIQPFHIEAQVVDLAGDALARMDGALNNINNAEFTQEDEYYLGRAVAANILAEYKPYNGDPELTQYLNRICQTLVINSSQSVIFNGYHVIILDSAEYNAFATPGGHIFLTKKLVDSAASEDMLAAVIAHELAHIILKHSITVIKNARFTDEMSAAANRALEIAGGNAETAKRFLDFRNSVQASVDTMLRNGYSQTQEFEADRKAAELLLDSGYNPGALTDMLTILQKEQHSQSGGFNTTHPSPAARIASVKGFNYRTGTDNSKYREPRFKRTARK